MGAKAKTEAGTKNVWKICFIVAVLIIIGLVVYIFVGPNLKNNVAAGKQADKNAGTSQSEEDTFRNIRLDEDITTDGRIEGIENLRWNNARITQHDKEMEVSIMLNNESEKEKIPANNLTVKLLDKSGNVIATKDVEMKEIAAKYGYSSLEMKFEEIKDYAVVYSIDISVKK